MYYLVNGYRFTQKNVCSKNQQKLIRQIWTVTLKNYMKMSFKRLSKKPFYLFLKMFSQDFSNRSYTSIKIILAYFYIIENIENSLPL